MSSNKRLPPGYIPALISWNPRSDVRVPGVRLPEAPSNYSVWHPGLPAPAEGFFPAPKNAVPVVEASDMSPAPKEPGNRLPAPGYGLSCTPIEKPSAVKKVVPPTGPQPKRPEAQQPLEEARKFLIHSGHHIEPLQAMSLASRNSALAPNIAPAFPTAQARVSTHSAMSSTSLTTATMQRGDQIPQPRDPLSTCGDRSSEKERKRNRKQQDHHEYLAIRNDPVLFQKYNDLLRSGGLSRVQALRAMRGDH